jgi:hypothetical protein
VPIPPPTTKSKLPEGPPPPGSPVDALSLMLMAAPADPSAFCGTYCIPMPA